MKNLLTVVIPTFNEADNITRCIDSIIAQKGSDGIHIVVADGGSTDGTQDIVMMLARTRAAHAWIELVPGGKVAVGRNNGLKRALTQNVVFIDADVELSEPHMLSEANFLLMGSYRLVGAPLRSRSGYPSNIAYGLFNLAMHLLTAKHAFAVGSFFAVSTYDIRKWGGFDETLVHSEDWVLSQKCKPKHFARLQHPVIVDDRRFKKFGYFNMLKTLYMSYTRGTDYMRQDNGYWNS